MSYGWFTKDKLIFKFNKIVQVFWCIIKRFLTIIVEEQYTYTHLTINTRYDSGVWHRLPPLVPAHKVNKASKQLIEPNILQCKATQAISRKLITIHATHKKD